MTRMTFKIALIAVLCSICTYLWLATRGAKDIVRLEPQGEPPIIHIDFGPTLAGERKTRNLTFYNAAGEPLLLRSVAGCSCVRLTLPNPQVNSHERAEAEVVLNMSQSPETSRQFRERVLVRAKAASGESVAAILSVMAKPMPSLRISHRQIAWHVNETWRSGTTKYVGFTNDCTAPLSVQQSSGSTTVVHLAEPNGLVIDAGATVKVGLRLDASCNELPSSVIVPLLFDCSVLDGSKRKLQHRCEAIVVRTCCIAAVPSSLVFTGGERQKSFRLVAHGGQCFL